MRGTSRACLLWHPAIPPQFGCLLVEEEQGPAADVGRRTAATTGTKEEGRSDGGLGGLRMRTGGLTEKPRSRRRRTERLGLEINIARHETAAPQP